MLKIIKKYSFWSEITKYYIKVTFSAQGSQNASKGAIFKRQQIKEFCEKNINLKEKSFAMNRDKVNPIYFLR